MSGDSEIDLKGLRDMLGLAEPEKSEPTAFALSVGEAIAKALGSLREAGVIEVEEAKLEPLATEITDVALESHSAERLPLRIVKALVHSDLVEEVYGTDEEISSALRPFLDEL